MSRTLGSDTCESEGRSVLVVRGWVERSCQQPDDTSLQKSVKCTSGMTGCVVQGYLEWSALTESARCMILLQANNSTNKAQLMFWKNKHFGDLQLILQGFYTLMKGFQHCWYQGPSNMIPLLMKQHKTLFNVGKVQISASYLTVATYSFEKNMTLPRYFCKTPKRSYTYNSA